MKRMIFVTLFLFLSFCSMFGQEKTMAPFPNQLSQEVVAKWITFCKTGEIIEYKYPIDTNKVSVEDQVKVFNYLLSTGFKPKYLSQLTAVSCCMTLISNTRAIERRPDGLPSYYFSMYSGIQDKNLEPSAKRDALILYHDISKILGLK